MGKIAVYQVDGKMPNLALMKVAQFHESLGDEVEHFFPMKEYDKVYVSKIFTFSKIIHPLPPNAIIGGTGVDFFNKLPDAIENCRPSYRLWPNCNFHLGFSIKGCRFKCDFCCVPKKEGKPYIVSNIRDILINPNGGNRLMLLDNDFFGGALWQENLLEIIALKLKVSFCQGLNIRTITEEQAYLLSKVNFRSQSFKSKMLSFAWDNVKHEKLIFRGIDRLNKAGIRNEQMQFFILIGYNSDIESDLYRINRLHSIGCKPFVMPYDKSNPYQKKVARWCNRREIINVQPDFHKYQKEVNYGIQNSRSTRAAFGLFNDVD
jgi:hypothetical protein